jgi:hypothetical protein
MVSLLGSRVEKNKALNATNHTRAQAAPRFDIAATGGAALEFDGGSIVDSEEAVKHSLAKQAARKKTPQCFHWGARNQILCGECKCGDNPFEKRGAAAGKLPESIRGERRASAIG